MVASDGVFGLEGTEIPFRFSEVLSVALIHNVLRQIR